MKEKEEILADTGSGTKKGSCKNLGMATIPFAMTDFDEDFINNFSFSPSLNLNSDPNQIINNPNSHYGNPDLARRKLDSN